MVKLAFTYDEAAAATGAGRRALQDAVRDGHLVASYVGTKPLIAAEELDRWLKTLPHEPVRRAS
jgi:excisionase family DNA binding protein